MLAVIQSFTPALAGRELETLRAHLRGLGAELTIAADAGAWWIGPDDEPRPANADELVALARLPRDRDAVVVVDGAGSVRFSHAADGPLADSLGQALAAATDALYVTRPPRVTFNRREWSLACLCTGFAFALISCQRKPAAPPPAPAPRETDVDLDVVLQVNGAERRLRIDPRGSLLDVLR